MTVDVRTTEISSKVQFSPDFAEAWRHRAIAVVLAARNVKVRYKQTVLGGLWLALQPLFLAGVLTVVVGLFLQAPSDGLPYALFALSGTTLWTMFNRAISDATASLAATGSIIQKVYFPRILIPTSAVITVVVELVPVYAVLVAMVAGWGLFPGWNILASPVFILLALLLALAVGLCMTALDAVFRDVRFVTPALMQLVMYLSPVIYSASAVPAPWRTLYKLNPVVGIIDGFRWSMIAGAAPPEVLSLASTCMFIVVTAVLGVALFTRLETFAIDRI